MNFEVFIKLFGSVFLIVAGIMAKYSHNDGWSTVKKYWVYLVILGVVSLIFDVIKYLI
jgi:hypothetical protein